MLKLCDKIMEIPVEIKEHMVKKYLEQTQKLQWIHFYKNRMAERPDVCDVEEINLQLFKISDWLKRDFKMLSNKTELHQALTLTESAVSEQDQIEHGMMQNPTGRKPKLNLALIHTFQEIGWVDPFPAEMKA